MSDIIKTARLLTIAVTTLAVLALINTIEPAEARGVRVDAGDWDQSGFISGQSTESLGFTIDILGVSTSAATISSDGSVILSDGTNAATINVLFDTGQSAGGNTSQFQFGVTNANFNQAGVDAGFRVSWQVFDSGGALLNEYQLAFFALTSGQFSMEFNYNQITFGDDNTQIGYTTSHGDSLDLPAALGLDFSEYSGIGDDGTPDNCVTKPTALACNNYDHATMTFGPETTVLPDIANGFFRQIDSNGDPVQGRYLFLTGEMDSDNDHVADADDVCPATVIPEGAPTRGLGWRRWTLDNSDGSFTQRRKSHWSFFNFTTADTRGCSCEQIIDASNFGRYISKINRKYGCSTLVMLHWINRQ